ncbi:uncharacterized protein LAJ45_07320 [Morchella importuna]|uniref:uncharacterized protein n=1 Tax=Morchella importuna TaxID=1174673 RepID=UPI001E8EB1CA|nr:uncharacterized protein LAJ45_07320 [Morchella importuna]KAH8148609.1 hypothetical protein LAJ45_07320 [Morchella importuna]
MRIGNYGISQAASTYSVLHPGTCYIERFKSPELRVRSVGIRLGKSDFPACWNSGLQMIKGHGYLALGSLDGISNRNIHPGHVFQVRNSCFLQMFLGHCDSNWWKVARVYLMRVPYCFHLACMIVHMQWAKL